MNISSNRTRDLSFLEIRPIFTAITTRDIKKCYSKIILQKMRSNNQNIKHMLKINCNQYLYSKKQSVITFIQYMKYYLFGPHGLLLRKFKWIRDSFSHKKHKHHKSHFSFQSKIQVGQLAYFEMKENKSSYAGYVKESKKGVFKRSSNFSIDENYKSNQIYNQFLSQSKKMKRTSYVEKNMYLTNLSNTFSKLNMFNNNNINQGQSSQVSFNYDDKTRLLTESVISKNKNYFSRPMSVSSNVNTTYTNRVNSPKKQLKLNTDRTATPHILHSSLKLRKKLNIASNIINAKCLGIKKQNENNHKKILRVFSRGNSPPSLKMNNLLCNSWSPKHKYKQSISSQLDHEKKKDLEAALDMKIGEDPNKNYMKVIEKIQEIDDTDYIRTVINLSNEIAKVNDETAMNFSKLIKEDYNKKTCKKKIVLSELTKKMKLRLHMNSNQIEKMIRKLDKVKCKLLS